MNYKHSCVIDAQNIYKTLVLVLLKQNDTNGDLNLGEFGAAHVAKLSKTDLMMERAQKYVPELGDEPVVYAGPTDDGRIFYYSALDKGLTVAIILEDVELETAVTFVGPVINDEGTLYVVDDGRKIAFEFSVSNTEEEIQFYKLQDGEYLVDTTPPTMRPYAGTTGFVSPKWDADTSAWTEAATEEEIIAWEAEHPAPMQPDPVPTDTDILNTLLGVN